MKAGAELVTEEVGSSVFGIDRKVDDGRGGDGASTGVLAMPASRVSGELVLGGGPGFGDEWIGVAAGVELAGPGIETGRLVEADVTVDDRLER